MTANQAWDEVVDLETPGGDARRTRSQDDCVT